MSVAAEAELFLAEEALIASPLGDQEPASTTPLTEEPASTTPLTEEPASTTPLTEEPASSTHVTEEPASTTPLTEEPVSTTPLTEEPASSTPVTEEPASSTHVTEEPASSTPLTEEPASSTPLTEEPASSTPVTEEPASSTHVTEEPASSTPVTEEPASSTPLTEEPASSTPVTEEPASSTPVTEEPASPTPVTEEPASSTPVNEEPRQKVHPDQQDKQSPDQGSIPVEPVAFGGKLPETVAERITKAQELKQEGNGFFKTGKWKKAIGRYHRALLFVKGITDRFEAVPGVPLKEIAKVKATAEEETAATSLLVAISNNLAACLMKMEEWEKALVHTAKVLKLEPKNTKALFRSGVVKLNLNRLEEAEEHLKKAEEIEPEDAGIKKQLQLLQHKRKQYQKSEQQMYSAMFKR